MPNQKTKFKQIEIGEIPEEWEVVKITDLVRFKKGTEPGTKNYNKEGRGVRFLRVSNVSGSRNDVIYTDIEDIQICEENDVLVTFDGSPGIVKRGLKGAYSSGIRKVEIKDSQRVSLNFTFYVLQTDIVQKIIKEHSSGVTIKHAGKSIPHIKIPYPSLPEQKKIAYVLTSIQDAIQKQEQIIEKTKELKKSLMHKLFTEGTRGESQKQTEIGLMPENWDLVNFENTLTQNKVSKKNQIKSSDILDSGKYVVVDQGQDYIAGYSNEKNKLVKHKTPHIIFGDHTRYFKYVDFPYILGADGTKVLAPNTEMFLPKFYYFCLKSLNIPSKGYSRHYKYLKEKLIKKPPIEEQREISDILTSFEAKIRISKTKKQKLRELFKSLLHQLMQGKIRVNNLEFKV